MLRMLLLLLVLHSAYLPSEAEAQDRKSPAHSSDAFEQAIRQGDARPYLSVDYGVSTPQFKGAEVDFGGIGLLEFKLGFVDLDSMGASLVSIMDSYFFASFANEGLGSWGGDGEVGSKYNRFGGGNRLGYGYQGQRMGLDLYNQNSMNWTQFEPEDYEAADPAAQAIFDRYGSSYRFGQLVEAGMKLRVTPSMALSAGMEGSIIYPRYVFWPWLGSAAIYSGAQGIVEFFGDDFVRASPTLGPALYFLLKTGVSLGYYLASRDDMNWPFSSETPVTVETFKVSATFSF